jgi:hypothetical protein
VAQTSTEAWIIRVIAVSYELPAGAWVVVCVGGGLTAEDASPVVAFHHGCPEIVTMCRVIAALGGRSSHPVSLAVVALA